MKKNFVREFALKLSVSFGIIFLVFCFFVLPGLFILWSEEPAPAYAQQLQKAVKATAWSGTVGSTKKISVPDYVVGIAIRNLDSADDVQISFDSQTSWWTVPSNATNPADTFPIGRSQIWLRKHPDAAGPADVELLFLIN